MRKEHGWVSVFVLVVGVLLTLALLGSLQRADRARQTLTRENLDLSAETLANAGQEDAQSRLQNRDYDKHEMSIWECGFDPQGAGQRDCSSPLAAVYTRRYTVRIDPDPSPTDKVRVTSTGKAGNVTHTVTRVYGFNEDPRYLAVLWALDPTQDMDLSALANVYGPVRLSSPSHNVYLRDAVDLSPLSAGNDWCCIWSEGNIFRGSTPCTHADNTKCLPNSGISYFNSSYFTPPADLAAPGPRSYYGYVQNMMPNEIYDCLLDNSNTTNPGGGAGRVFSIGGMDTGDKGIGVGKTTDTTYYDFADTSGANICGNSSMPINKRIIRIRSGTGSNYRVIFRSLVYKNVGAFLIDDPDHISVEFDPSARFIRRVWCPNVATCTSTGPQPDTADKQSAMAIFTPRALSLALPAGTPNGLIFASNFIFEGVLLAPFATVNLKNYTTIRGSLIAGKFDTSAVVNNLNLLVDRDLLRHLPPALPYAVNPVPDP